MQWESDLNHNLWLYHGCPAFGNYFNFSSIWMELSSGWFCRIGGSTHSGRSWKFLPHWVCTEKSQTNHIALNEPLYLKVGDTSWPVGDNVLWVNFYQTSYWITLSLRQSNSASEFCWVSDERFIQSSVCRPRPATFKGEFIEMMLDVLQTRSRLKNQTLPIRVHSPGNGSRWSWKTKSAVSIYRNHFAGMANLNV